MASPVKRSEFETTEENIRQIEYILPKLKYSVYISHVKRWLENFDAEDLPFAYDFLFFLEYITFDELQYRLIALINNNIFKVYPDKKLLFIPFAKYGKSCDLMIYLITHTQFYKDLEANGKARYSRNTNNKEIIVEKDEIIVFIDDIIASGRSFERDIIRHGIGDFLINNDLFTNEIYYVGGILTHKAKEFLFYNFPEINVIGDIRSRVFCPTHSPFRIGYGPKKMKEIAYKYGMGIKTFNKDPYYQPMGFSNCEALVAFEYATPNNTLPIIWGDKKWYPIFPRKAENRMDRAKAIKKDVAFYLGLMRRLELELYNNVRVPTENKMYDYNSQKDHSLVTILLLKQRKYNELLILQIIGITKSELDDIYKYGQGRNLLDTDNNLTSRGNDFLTNLLESTKLKTGKEKELEDFERKNYIYVPKIFKGTA